jgi:hypothetical protein
MTGAATIQWRGRAVPAVLPGVEFEEKGHKYRVNGQSWPSVTSFLEDYYHGPQESAGAKWGTSAHKHVFHFMAKTLDMERLNPRMKPTLDGWLDALSFFKVPPGAEMLAEYIVYSARFHFIGRFDFLFALPDMDLLLDLKTGGQGEMESRKTGLQLGGYCHGIIEHGLSTISRLRAAEANIQQNGTMTPRWFKTREIMRVFLAQVEVKNYFQKI